MYQCEKACKGFVMSLKMNNAYNIVFFQSNPPKLSRGQVVWAVRKIKLISHVYNKIQSEE